MVHTALARQQVVPLLAAERRRLIADALQRRKKVRVVSVGRSITLLTSGVLSNLGQIGASQPCVAERHTLFVPWRGLLRLCNALPKNLIDAALRKGAAIRLVSAPLHSSAQSLSFCLSQPRTKGRVNRRFRALSGKGLQPRQSLGRIVEDVDALGYHGNIISQTRYVYPDASHLQNGPETKATGTELEVK